MEDCIFCRIVRGDIPSYKVYEDDQYLSFMDVFPRTKGHALVIPKKHYRWVYDVPEFGAYFEVAKKVGMAIQKQMKSRFVSFLTVGEEVPHAHIHILPQSASKIEGFEITERISMEKNEISQLADDVKKLL